MSSTDFNEALLFETQQGGVSKFGLKLKLTTSK
jgi:hypothetical protein